MSFYDIYRKYRDLDLRENFRSLDSFSIQNCLDKETLNERDLIALVSPLFEEYLEQAAEKANRLTANNFGKTIQLYTPLYLSNYCENSCVYCGFNQDNSIKRRKLSLAEVEKEAQFISSTGLRNILILTGESRTMSPVSYIKDCVDVLKKYFSSISIEIYSLSESEYAELVSCGVDGLVVYQEVYDQELYFKLHKGPKADYKFRLDSPERGARAGIRNISLGSLLGLGEWRKEAFMLGLHFKYLQEKFPDVDYGVSVPRIQPQVSGFKAPNPVSDKDMAQMIIALRLFLPRLSISLSTREDPLLRENLIPLGVTKISAGSSTAVGARIYRESAGTGQFTIKDNRKVEEIKNMLESKGYQPVFKDWLSL